MKIVNFNNGIRGRIPNEWKSETNDGVVSLYEPDNGVGALQLSFYLDNASFIDPSEELESYLGNKHEKIIVKIIDGRAYFDIEDEYGVYWQYWLFLQDRTVIFASYNCDKSDKGIEDHIVKEIIGSIGL